MTTEQRTQPSTENSKTFPSKLLGKNSGGGDSLCRPYGDVQGCADYTFFYRKLSERVRTKNFLIFGHFLRAKSFLTRSGVKTDIDLEFWQSPTSLHRSKVDGPRKFWRIESSPPPLLD